MRVCILTEGYNYTGYGHISRTIALAHAFRERKAEVVFVVHGDRNAAKLLAGYTVHLMNWSEEDVALISLLKQADVALIDSYLVEAGRYWFICQYAPFCIFLDDFIRIPYPEGILVNGAIGAESLPYPDRENQTLLLGKDYTILRKPFRETSQPRLIKENIETVLITFGGSDPLNMTREVLAKFVSGKNTKKKWVVLGAACQNTEALHKVGDAHTEYFSNISAEQMKLLMFESDLAVSAAGQTIHELAVTGTPSIIFQVAENQNNNIKGCCSIGFIEDFADATAPDWVDKFESLLARIEDPDYRRSLSRRGQTAIDGKGCDRIVKTVIHRYLSANMSLRKACGNDLIPLFYLANDAMVRQNSFNQNPISLEEHSVWFHASLKSPHRVLYVFEADSELIGQIRFDLENAEEAVVSISLSSSFRGLGMAAGMLVRSLTEIKQEHNALFRIFAYVKEKNNASRQAFLKALFSECGMENQIVKFIYTYER